MLPEIATIVQEVSRPSEENPDRIFDFERREAAPTILARGSDPGRDAKTCKSQVVT